MMYHSLCDLELLCCIISILAACLSSCSLFSSAMTPQLRCGANFISSDLYLEVCRFFVIVICLFWGRYSLYRRLYLCFEVDFQISFLFLKRIKSRGITTRNAKDDTCRYCSGTKKHTTFGKVINKML